MTRTVWKKMVLSIALCSAVTPAAAQTPAGPAPAAAQAPAAATAPTKEEQEKRRREEYEFGAGRRLGTCLAAGCAVFEGAVVGVGEPSKAGNEAGGRGYFTQQVSVAVGELLRGERPAPGSTALLTYASTPAVASSGGAWEVWANVTPQPRTKLLVALWEGEAKKDRQRLGPAAEVAVAVADEGLIAKLSELVTLYEFYADQPERLAAAPQLLDSKRDFAFGGYAVAVLERGLDWRSADRTAFALAKLLASGDLSEVAGFFYAYRALRRAMLYPEAEISAATRALVAETLVAAGAGGNDWQARQAITTLALLAEGKRIELKTSLDPERRRKLIENFRRLYAQDDAQRSPYAALRAQLGIR